MNLRHASRNRARCPPARAVTLRSLRPAEQQLLELVRQLGYGTLADIRIAGGELVLHAGFKIRRRHRLGQRDSPTGPPDEQHNYVLKELHLDLVTQIRALAQGRIVRLEVQDGLPVHLEIEQEFWRQSG